MVLGGTIALILVFVFFMGATLKARDIDRGDARFDAVEPDQRPREYVRRPVRKRMLRILYGLSTLLALALIAEIVWLWPR